MSYHYHGGPTAPFIHLVSAFCFVIPRIFIEAKLIEVGFLSRGKHQIIIVLHGGIKMRDCLFAFTKYPVSVDRCIML